jgi:hypothetical protein
MEGVVIIAYKSKPITWRDVRRLGKCMVTESCNSYSINGTKSTGLVVAPNPRAKHFADGKHISA